MELMLAYHSPIFGRLTGQWHLRPLPYRTLHTFLPSWSAKERIAAYALVGGVPTYLQWLDPTRSLVKNIRQVMLAPGSLVMAEVEFLLYDELHEPRTYLAILQAIGNGAHTLTEIVNASLVSTTNLSNYLAQLQVLRLVEKRLPTTWGAVRAGSCWWRANTRSQSATLTPSGGQFAPAARAASTAAVSSGGHAARSCAAVGGASLGVRSARSGHFSMASAAASAWRCKIWVLAIWAFVSN